MKNTNKNLKKLEEIENEVDSYNVDQKWIKFYQKSKKEVIDFPEIGTQVGVDSDPSIDVPIHLRGGEFHWNFEKKPMALVDKITWVLTAVNVAILGYLIIKNLN